MHSAAMKKLWFSALFIALSLSIASADAPAYRAHATATGIDPSVTITATTGDALFVTVVSAEHLVADLAPQTADDDQAGSWVSVNCGAIWKTGQQGNKSKFALTSTLLREDLIASDGDIEITVDTRGKNAAVVVMAVSGISLWNPVPPISGCGNVDPPSFPQGSVRMVKNTPYCVNCGVNPIVASSTPAVPKPGQQTTAFDTSSMTIAVFANQESSPSVSAPSGWTQRATVSRTFSGKTIALNISTRDSGFSGSTITWGSTTPTDGSAQAIEIRPLQ